METALSGTTIHEEHQSFWVLIVIMLVVAAILILTAVLTGANPNVMAPEDIASTCVAVLFAAVVLWGFSRLNVVITSTEIRFGFPIWHRHVPVTQVVVGEIVKIPFWYGIGLHYVGRMWVYNARLGRGVMVAIGGKRYLIGSDNPERLQAAMLQVAPNRAKT